MKKLIMTKGLPASGKDTKYKKLVEESDGKMKRINKDDLREMLDTSIWSKHNEDKVLKIRDMLIEDFLQDDKIESVVVTDTNLHKKHEIRLKELADKYNAEFIIDDFFLSVSVKECIERDNKREKPVGEKVIRKMYKDYLWKFLRREDYKWCLEMVVGKHEAIIVDLDGTLALHDGRNPYDVDKCDTDIPNYPLVKVIDALQHSFKMPIIFVSGREGTRVNVEKTLYWLNEQFFFEFNLYMRGAGDKRPDYKVKKEIYENCIKNNFNVLFVLDDRPQVIKMWRELGLFVLDCNQFPERGEF